LDVDHLAAINARCGNRAGDSLLRQLARMLEKHAGERAQVGRTGGDTFGVLLEGVTVEEAGQFAERQRHAVDQSRCVWKGETFPLTVSVAFATLGVETSSHTLLVDLECACERARDEGGNRLASSEATAGGPPAHTADAPVVWTGRVRETLDEGQLMLRHQRVQPLDDQDAAKPHFELLLGVRGPGGGLLLPRDFIRAAEHAELMPSVDRWVLHKALTWMAAHRPELMRAGSYSVNVAGSTLKDRGFIDYVMETLSSSKVPPAKLLFEIPEAVARSDLAAARDFVRVLREYGCRFALDRFGGGEESLAALEKLPVDYVKIDGGFVADMGRNASDLAVVQSANEIGHFMGLKTVANYVEDAGTLEHLRELGVDYAQGFGIEAPVPLED
jgi:Amt family ammonium transporter